MPTPTDGVTGIVCEPRYYCPQGTPVQLGCPIGQYNDQYGQENCTYCPPGTMCPVVNMTTPEMCRMGMAIQLDNYEKNG